MTILIVCAATVCLALFIEPHHSETPTSELLYYTAYNVAVGWLVGFLFFDRLATDGLALFALRACSAIVCGALVNEAVVGPLAFGSGPINAVSFYYMLTDSVSLAGVFVLIRLAQRLHSLHQRLPSKPEAASAGLANAEAHCLFVRVANGTQRLYAPDILYVAAERDFTRIVCATGEHFVSENLKSLVERSAEFGLVRVHKSFAVNLRRVDRLTRADVVLGDRRVPVGRRYRAAFVETWSAHPACSESG